nr:HXXEE domain-containing protein [Alteribacillus bidgolensis]
MLQFIFFKEYVPGIITSILLIFPYSYLTVKFLLAENVLTIKKFLQFLFMGFVLQAPLALLAHFISQLLGNHLGLLFH